jgi:hypothetical protein
MAGLTVTLRRQETQDGDQRVPTDPPWWGYHPPRHRDIRRLVSGGPTLEKLQIERDERIRILRGSENIEHWRLADALANAEPGEPVKLGACPLNARLFQVYAASRILEQLEALPDLYMVTVADGREAIGVEGLPALKWVRLHNRLRRRIERSVSRTAFGVGIGELEFHDDTKTFHPHHHLFVGNVDRDELERLRPHYPFVEGAGAAMRVDRVPERHRQISYALKLNVWRKPFSRSGPQRARAVRLRPPEFRAHMAYLASIDLRRLLFGLRVRLDDR